jgi:hypothetical protein
MYVHSNSRYGVGNLWESQKNYELAATAVFYVGSFHTTCARICGGKLQKYILNRLGSESSLVTTNTRLA